MVVVLAAGAAVNDVQLEVGKWCWLRWDEVVQSEARQVGARPWHRRWSEAPRRGRRPRSWACLDVDWAALPPSIAAPESRRSP
eukprot:6469161-Amphidinium_carterae.3